jgi:MFS family permease
VLSVTLSTLLVCSLSLTGHWAFQFWYLQHLRNLPDLAEWSDAEKTQFVSKVVVIVIVTSITGNFVAGALAKWLSYRRAIACICVGYFLAMAVTYARPQPPAVLYVGVAVIGLGQGVFALFTMYLPSLFPTLLRTTGAGFCYNIGRIAAGLGTVFFGLFSHVGDYRLALFYAAFLFLPAGAVAWLMPDPAHEGKEEI